MACIARRRRGDQRERTKNLAFGVVLITSRKLAHGLCVTVQPFLVRHGISVRVNQTDGVDESALAIRTVEPFRLFDFSKAASNVLRCNCWLPQLMEISHGDTPVRRSAIRVLGCYVSKFFFRCRVCERMQKRYRSPETFLCFARARSWKLDTAKFFRDRMLVFRDGGRRLRITPRQQNKADTRSEHRARY